MKDLHLRLRTLLFLVPYVVRNRGVPVSELAKRLALTEKELLEELDFLLMIGRPPFQPDDLIEIFEEGGRVYVHLHQSLEKPPRFTGFEALALACAAQIFTGPEMGDASVAVQVAIDKVVQSLPEDTRKLFSELSEHYLVLPGGSAAPHLELLRKAVEERREVDLEHYSAGRGELTERTVRPYGLHHRRGVWYLVAYCTLREDVRVFRLSRIRNARLTDRIFDPPEELDLAKIVERNITVPAHGELPCVIRFAPGVARWVEERWGAEYLTRQEDGSVVARLSDVSDAFLLSYVASFGGEAVIESPPDLASLLREEAQKALARYA